MPFTVTRPGGMTDAEYLAYRLALCRTGCDLGRVARILDPETGRYWLATWDEAEVAKRVQEHLEEVTGITDWQLLEIPASAGEGPLGPIVLQYHFDRSGLVFVLDDVSEEVLASAFPDRAVIATYLTLEQSAWERYRLRHGGFLPLVREILPVLTRLPPDELASLGFLVVESGTEKNAPAFASGSPGSCLTGAIGLGSSVVSPVGRMKQR